MIIIITGSPGSGKSKVAKCLLEKIENSAWIDGDHMLETNPFDRNQQRKLRYENIALLVKNYEEGGFKNIYISFVYARREDLDDQIGLFNGIDQVKIFALVPSPEALRVRHSEDSYDRVDIDSSVELNKKIAELENIIIIDNSLLSAKQIAELITKTVVF